MNTLQKLRRTLIGLTAQGNRAETKGDIRRLFAMAAGAMRQPGGLRGAAEGIAELMVLKEDETSAWVAPDEIVSSGGRFDACDLRHWIAIAEASGIPAIPAVPILTLTEDEIAVVSGTVEVPDTAVTRGVRKVAAALASGSEPPEKEILVPDRAVVAEKCSAAMNGVPEGWMVRHARCGPSTLKTLAGSGTAGGTVPDVDFGPDLAVGPGWIRNGNRRRVDVTDGRTMKVGIGSGPDAPHTWLARPWVKSSRWTIGEDPHRHGTPFQGQGFWPAEWRVFVEGGLVTGVSYYYPWAGMASPEDAANAFKVRDLAQRLVDAAIGFGAIPAFMDIEFARRNPQFVEMGMEERFPRDGFACTLDFMEADVDGEPGFVLLEGGPPLCVFGGGHPCGFIPVVGRTHRAEGVALKLPDGVHMMEPSTWNVPVEGAIFTWEEAAVLAAGFQPSTFSP